MNYSKRERRGMALVLVLFASALVLAAVSFVVYQVHSAKRMTDVDANIQMLDEACKAGVDIAIERIWNQYVTGNGNTTGNLASFRMFADGVVRSNEDTNGNGRKDQDESDLDGDGNFEIAQPLALITATDPRAMETADGGILPVEISGITLSRVDDLTGCNFTISVTSRIGAMTRTATQTARVSGVPFSGFSYGVMANNVNCIMCHAEFKALDMERALGAPGTYNTFDRIKVATLESLLIRPSSCDSNIAGTLYTRGVITNESGTTLTAAQLATSQLKGYQFDQTNGKLVQNATGGMTKTNLTAGTLDAEGRLQPFANYYSGYPTDASKMTDGDLPNTFPAPYGDDNEDRYVNDDEFERVMNSAKGSITGGVANGVPHGGTYGSTSLPSASNAAATSLTSGTYDGNLILVGTEANPIVLNGDVAINGDLVITGKVKGWGQLFVRGNSYVVGDVTYADAAGEFGKAADGTENGLSLVSGGSVLMGDYLTIRGKNNTKDTSKYPNTSYSVQCRTPNKSSNSTVSGTTQTLRYGYFDPGVVDAGGIQTTMVDATGATVTRTGQQFSFTTSELMLFNNLEVEKMAEDSDYIPRFYGLRDTQADALYCYEHPPDEHSVRYDEAGGGVKSITDFMMLKGVDVNRLNTAAIHYMNPTGSWISETALRQIWYNDEMTRPSSGRPFQFDGLVYSNNAIFGIARSRKRHGSFTDGMITVRGSIICPDLGILAAGPDTAGCKSFKLFYDRRVQRFYALEDTTQVTFRRLAFAKGSGNLAED